MIKKDDNPNGIDPALVEATRTAWREDFPRWVAAGAPAFFGAAVSPELMAWAISLMLPMPLYVQLLVARASLETDLRADLPNIDVPTLFVHGEADASVPFALGQAAASLVPRSRFLGYAGAAHGLMFTHARRLHDDVLAFIRD
jgi:pimeloyl-ACP methyl ester carboxylesterase